MKRGVNMSSQGDKGAGKIVIFFLLWWLGSAGIGTLHYVSAADWMSWIIIILILIWGSFLWWLCNKIG